MPTDAQRCPDITMITSESIVGLMDKKPLVNLIARFADGSEKAIGQFRAEEARDMAQHLLTTAEAAFSDTAVFLMLRSYDLSEEEATKMIMGLRKFRADM